MDETRQVVFEVNGQIVTDEKGRTVAIVGGQELTPEQASAILDGADVTVEK